MYSGGENAAPQGNQPKVNSPEIPNSLTGETTSPVEANAEGGNAPGMKRIPTALQEKVNANGVVVQGGVDFIGKRLWGFYKEKST